MSEVELFSINLALSNLCGAKCIFCPINRYKKKPPYNMPHLNAKKIADEVSRNIHSVKRFEIGENGDALLNPEFIEIVRYIKSTNPNVEVDMFTNFQHLTKDISEVIVMENLIDNLCVNIDGHDEETYFRVKGLSYNTVEQNVIDFIKVRNEHGSKIRLAIQALTYTDYANRVIAKFNKFPVAVESLYSTDDFTEIRDVWKNRLNPKLDVFFRSHAFGWAERDSINKVNPENYNCPIFTRVRDECFIAPNGDWYACCYDDKQQLIFGNVIEKSITEVYFGKDRKHILQLLEERRYTEIGYPCTLVEACQWI